jgi:hypothetical protein
MLGLLFIMGGGNNFYTWAVTLPLVRDRLALALPFELHRSFPPLLLFGASCWQVCDPQHRIRMARQHHVWCTHTDA